MRISTRAARISLTVTSLLLALALMISCATKPPVILGESKTAKINQGEPAPFSGWMLTDDAMAKLLELAEIGKTTKK